MRGRQCRTQTGILHTDFDGENGGRYESLKKNRRVSGLGLFNVRDVVERHHGTMDIQHDENRFSISILLRLGESA